MPRAHGAKVKPACQPPHLTTPGKAGKVRAMKQTAQQKLERFQARLEAAYRKRHEALRLRETGKTVQEVGDIMGVTKQRASQMILEARAERDGA